MARAQKSPEQVVVEEARRRADADPAVKAAMLALSSLPEMKALLARFGAEAEAADAEVGAHIVAVQPRAVLALLDRALGCLHECANFFDGRADISDETDDDGSPRPNAEMSMLAEIEEVLALCGRPR